MTDLENKNTQIPENKSMAPAEKPLLGEPITDVSASTMKLVKERYAVLATVLIIVAVAWEIVTIFFILPELKSTRGVLTLFLLPFIAIAVFYSIIRSKVRHAFMEQFAKANNYEYQLNGKPDDFDGVIFKIGHSRSVTDLITGQYQNIPIQLFNYNYSTGSGKTRRTYFFTVFKIQFGFDLPHVMLESRGQNYGDLLTDELQRTNHISLEGDFNKYFSLHVMKKFEIEALQIFTPDVMAKFIDNWWDYSAEFSGNRIFLYEEGFISTREELTVFYDMARYIITELKPVLSKISDEVAALKEYQQKI